MKKLTALLLAAILTASLLCGCGSTTAAGTEADTWAAGAAEPNTSADVKVIRLAASDPASYPLCQADSYFAEKLGELSGGKLKVETFFDGVLGEEADTVEGLGLGMLEMARVSAGNMSTFIPELELYNLPYLFTSEEQFLAAITGDVKNIYAGLFENAGYKLITFYDEGTRYIFNKTECVTEPAQLKGLKIRTMGAQSIQDGFAAMGASPTPMSSGEVYTSLSQGVIDACENNYSTIYSNKLYEAAKYFSNTEHMRVPSVLLCSLDYWNGFTAEEQEMIAEAAAAAFDYAREVFNAGEQEAFDAMMAEGCVYAELSDEQRAAFSALCAPVHEKYASNDISRQILEQIRALT